MRYQSRMHPTLDILCDSMGRVFVPENGVHKAHWTFGCLHSNGYRTVKIDNKVYRVPRLICETFHGLAPADRPTCDHIDRNRDSNVPENLRWASRKTQADNTANVINRRDYGVRFCDDEKQYQHAHYVAHLEERKAYRAENLEKFKAKDAAYYAEHRNEILAKKREQYAKRKALRLAAKEN